MLHCLWASYTIHHLVTFMLCDTAERLYPVYVIKGGSKVWHVWQRYNVCFIAMYLKEMSDVKYVASETDYDDVFVDVAVAYSL